MATEERGERPEADGVPGGAAIEGSALAKETAINVGDLAGLSVEQLKGKVREARQDAQRNWQHFLHSAADLENYKKQAARERQDAVERTRRQMLLLVLSVVDNLERALAFDEAPDAQTGSGKRVQALLDGLRMSHREILDQLAAVGVRPIDAVGKPFDPRLHEAVGVVAPREAGHPPGTVVGEVLKGYLLNGDVLRPAKVTVAAARTGEEQSQGEREATRDK